MTLSPASSRGAPGLSVLSYVEATSDVLVNATVEATPTDVVSAAAYTFDGATRVRIEMNVPVISQSATGIVVFNLWESTNNLGYVGEAGPNINTMAPMVRYLTPTAGSKTYKLRAYRVAADVTLKGGAGGAAATFTPIFIQLSVA